MKTMKNSKKNGEKKPSNSKNSSSQVSIETPKIIVSKRVDTKLDFSIVQESTDSVESVKAKITIKNISSDEILLPQDIDMSDLHVVLSRLKRTPKNLVRYGYHLI